MPCLECNDGRPLEGRIAEWICLIASSSAASHQTITWVQDLFADGANDQITAQELINKAVQQGVTFANGDTIVAADKIMLIDIDLKPVNGTGQIWDDASAFVAKVATTSVAIFVNNAGESAMDPGGSRSSGNVFAFQKCEFDEIQLTNGTIVTCGVTFIQT